mgnify:CR=1 FL=1
MKHIQETDSAKEQIYVVHHNSIVFSTSKHQKAFAIKEKNVHEIVETIRKPTGKLKNTDLIRFIEEVLNALGEAPDEAEWVSEHVEPQHEHVHLLDGLLRVVPRDLTLQRRLVVERVLPLKVTQSEKVKSTEDVSYCGRFDEIINIFCDLIVCIFV